MFKSSYCLYRTKEVCVADIHSEELAVKAVEAMLTSAKGCSCAFPILAKRCLMSKWGCADKDEH